MHYRTHKGLNISEIGIGCYGLSGAYGPVDAEETKQVLLRAYELGVNFFDTAEAYGNAEQILGEVVKPFRKEVVIATKVGVREGIEPNLSASYISSACEESLRSLGMEYIDLYQVHFDDPKTPIEETVVALEELVQAGKIRYYGLGHLPVDRVKAYFQAGNVFSVLMELSAVARQARDGLLPLCGENGVGAIAFSVTGRGLLTGTYSPGHKFDPGDIRNFDPLFQRERFESGLRVAAKMREIGIHYRKSAVQVAIAWVLAQPGVICALTGSSSLPHLQENLGASGLRLAEQDIVDLEAFFEQEDKWLVNEQMTSVRRILNQPLPADATQAFTELVYVIETAVLLNLVSEEKVMPIFQELYPLHKKLIESAGVEMEELQRQLYKLIDLDALASML
jgi:aryl-alcohol dehydrogenase-like predicted oxidoreductase